MDFLSFKQVLDEERDIRDQGDDPEPDEDAESDDDDQ